MIARIRDKLAEVERNHPLAYAVGCLVIAAAAVLVATWGRQA